MRMTLVDKIAERVVIKLTGTGPESGDRRVCLNATPGVDGDVEDRVVLEFFEFTNFESPYSEKVKFSMDRMLKKDDNGKDYVVSVQETDDLFKTCSKNLHIGFYVEVTQKFDSNSLRCPTTVTVEVWGPYKPVNVDQYAEYTNNPSFTCKFDGKEFHERFHEHQDQQFHDADVSVLLHKRQTPFDVPGRRSKDDEQQWLLFSLIGRKKFRNWLQQWFCDQIDD